MHELCKFTERLSMRTCTVIIGENAVKKQTFIRHSISKQQSVQPSHPGVFTISWYCNATAISLIHSPADSALFNPASYTLKFIIIHRKTPADRWRSEQIKEFRCPKAASVKSDHFEYCTGNFTLVHHSPIGNRISKSGSTVTSSTKNA